MEQPDFNLQTFIFFLLILFSVFFTLSESQLIEGGNNLLVLHQMPKSH